MIQMVKYRKPTQLDVQHKNIGLVKHILNLYLFIMEEIITVKCLKRNINCVLNNFNLKNLKNFVNVITLSYVLFMIKFAES